LFLRLPDFFERARRRTGRNFCSSAGIIDAVKRNGAGCAGLKLHRESGVIVMLSWVVTFLIIALVAGILGFGGIAGVSIEIAKTIFFIAVVLFLISAVVGLARGRTRV
jgi:uncharacterized membrane protein YtjA (UPF0391 family)